MTDIQYSTRAGFFTRLFVGMVIILLGIIFTLDNLGILEGRVILEWWPALIVAYGMLRIVGVWRRPAPVCGLFLILIGGWMLLHSLGIVQRSVFAMWPLLLVFLGISIIRRSSGYGKRWGVIYGRRARSKEFDESLNSMKDSLQGMRDSLHGTAAGQAPTPGPGGAPPGGAGGFQAAPGPGAAGAAPEAAPGAASGGAPPGDGPIPADGSFNPDSSNAPGGGEGKQGPSSDVLKVDVILGNVTRKVASQNFKGGEIVAVLGGGDIDFRSARMAGPTARLEINLLMGGLNLYVPENWVVEYHGASIMGGVEDTSRRPAGEPIGRLILTGGVLLGGLVIKN